MEIVNTLDIDGSQWELQDVEARNKIAVLEAKTNVKRTSLWREGVSFFELIEIDGLKYFNGYFQSVFEVKTIGQVLFNFEPIEGMALVNRGFITGDKIDGSGRCPVVLSIGPDGIVSAYAIFNDIGQGAHPPISLYGQFFQLVT